MRGFAEIADDDDDVVSDAGDGTNSNSGSGEDDDDDNCSVHWLELEYLLDADAKLISELLVVANI